MLRTSILAALTFLISVLISGALVLSDVSSDELIPNKVLSQSTSPETSANVQKVLAARN